MFVEELREQMSTELAALNTALPELGWVQITERRSGAIRLTPVPAQPEPRNLRRIKAEVLRRWGSVPLIDMLKEAVLRTGCLGTVTSVATGGSIPPDVLAERLLLAIYAYGTNTGIKAVAAGGHGHSEDDIRYVAAATSPPRRPGPSRSASRTPPSPPAAPSCGAPGPPRSPRIPPTSGPSIRTSSPSGIPATAGAGS